MACTIQINSDQQNTNTYRSGRGGRIDGGGGRRGVNSRGSGRDGCGRLYHNMCVCVSIGSGMGK